MTDRLVHLIEPEAWEVARADGHVRPPSLDEVGFVHLCTTSQLGVVVGRHYAEHRALVVLVLDPNALDAELRWEESHPGEHYPHLYGPLPVAAVTEAAQWRPGPDGTWPQPPLSP